jgi:hypothetical protein
LAEFDALEDKLLAGMRPHPRKEHPHVGKFLPRVAWHLFDERALPMDHLVVAEYQNEMLMKCGLVATVHEITELVGISVKRTLGRFQGASTIAPQMRLKTRLSDTGKPRATELPNILRMKRPMRATV